MATPTSSALLPGVPTQVWQSRYRAPGGNRHPDAHVDATWRRVARALASAEATNAGAWEERFHAILEGFRFLPGGRIFAGAGSRRQVTLFNCFVMGCIPDTMEGIFTALKEGAITMQQGGGVGYDFSTLRPRGAAALRSGTTASGPVSFMHVWDSMCATLLSTGARRGAMIGALRCDHPDVEEFIAAKRDARALHHFNLSVLVTDAFMAAVRDDAAWPLVYPVRRGVRASGEWVDRTWPGEAAPQRCEVHRRVGARALWERLLQAAYDCAEPGVIFIDRVQQANNLAYCERVSATNPCGEIPLPEYGACDLGSVNLTRFVRDPFTAQARLDLDAIAQTAQVATRLLDDVYDVSRFPLRRQAIVARTSRRLGLGLTGLADALAMLGLEYGSPPAVELAGETMRTICEAAYRTSVALAREKGTFPAFDRDRYLAGEFIRALPADIVAGIARDGIRNSHLTAIAPTGSISLLAGNVSSGLEPIFTLRGERRIHLADGSECVVPVEDYAHRLFRASAGASARLPPAFVTAAEVSPAQQLAMQAALQRHVDNAISKTVRVAEDAPFGEFRDVYDEAYRLGLKGCTAYRPNPVRGGVLSADPAAPAARAPAD